MNDNALDISPQDLVLIKEILQQYIPKLEVRAFGSRVTHKAKKFSDLDLVIMSDKPLPLELLGELAEAFSESKLPIKIDILDWSRISEEFQQLILKKYLTLTY